MRSGVSDLFPALAEVVEPGERHVAIVGPTACGKSDLAHRLALRSKTDGTREFEIVSVDSMCVYRGMDIGTAKPSPKEQAAVAHHMLDLVDPWEEFSLSRFQTEALACIDDIESRGHRALLVGGTGLYLRAIVDRLRIPGRYPDVAARLARDLERDGAQALHARLSELDPAAATRMEPSNSRRIVRALEVTIGSGRPFSSFGPGLTDYPPCRFDLVGVDRPDVDERIASRIRWQLDTGFLEEVRCLVADSRGMSRTAGQALGYREMVAHLQGSCSFEEAVDELLRRTRSFARRQRRWFRRDPRLVWLT